jgi:hypothetical protein
MEKLIAQRSNIQVASKQIPLIRDSEKSSTTTRQLQQSRRVFHHCILFSLLFLSLSVSHSFIAYKQSIIIAIIFSLLLTVVQQASSEQRDSKETTSKSSYCYSSAVLEINSIIITTSQ